MAKATTDKLIVTHGAALQAKYGTGYTSIQAALKKLIAGDKARGLRTEVVELDSKTMMQKHGVKPAASVADERQCKAAVDRLYKALAPAYLVLLGAPDVVPHQSLTNPAEDEDPLVPSDLPYACDAAYGKDVSKFLGPTRVVSRLPDIQGGTDARYLTKLLTHAATWKSSPKKTYENYLALTAKVWHDSTALSAKKLFGNSTNLKDCPPGGPNWTKVQLKPKSHFINCHGDTPDDQFYGEDDDESMPVAMKSSQIDGKIAKGSIVSAECCYGTELYDPALAEINPGVCQVYLKNGAHAFFGSTTIAYGPAEGNGVADLICQYFLKYVLTGASTGRAALQARQDFVSQVGHLDPMELKTMAQFLLLGDPSIHPVAPAALPLPAAKSKKLKSLAAELVERPTSRLVRRAKLAARGLAVSAAASFARKAATLAPSDETADVLLSLARQAKIISPIVDGYRLVAKAPLGNVAKAKALHGVASGPTSFFVVTGLRDPDNPMTRIAFVAKEQAGELIAVRELHRR